MITFAQLTQQIKAEWDRKKYWMKETSNDTVKYKYFVCNVSHARFNGIKNIPIHTRANTMNDFIYNSQTKSCMAHYSRHLFVCFLSLFHTNRCSIPLNVYLSSLSFFLNTYRTWNTHSILHLDCITKELGDKL